MAELDNEVAEIVMDLGEMIMDPDYVTAYSFQYSPSENKIFVLKRNNQGKVIATREIRITLV